MKTAHSTWKELDHGAVALRQVRSGPNAADGVLIERMHCCLNNLHTHPIDVLVLISGDGGFTGLVMKAAEKGHTECTRVLLEAGSDVNATDDFERTAVALAGNGGHTAVVALLKRGGAAF